MRDMAENNIPEPDPYKEEQALWSVYRQTRRSRGIDIDKVLAEWVEQEKQKLNSPGAREDFAELCKDGCHAQALAAIVMLIRNCPRLEGLWTMVVGPPENRQKATRTLESAAATLEEFLGVFISAEGEKDQAEFAKIGRIPPSRMISELRLYGRAIRMAELLAIETEAHSLIEVSKYILSSYVNQMTRSFHDRNVSGLIGETADSTDFNEVAHRMWRYRNYERLEKNFSWMTNLLVAMSIVINRPA